MLTLDSIINFAIDLRSQFPKTNDTYLINGAVSYKGIKEDLDTINASIESYMIIRDLMTDFASSINCSIGRYKHGREEIETVLDNIGFTPVVNADNTDSKSLIPSLRQMDIPMIDYITEKTEPLYNVPIADGLSIPCITVEDKNLVRSDGNIYYIRQLNKFAFRLNGHLFSGNIGEVYTYEKNPKKIKACARGAQCKNITTCTYYHPGTTDIRNFISGGFAYQRRTFKDTSDDVPGRKIGNRSTLKTDIQRATKNDLQLFNDQCVHDILCSVSSMSVVPRDDNVSL